MIAQLEIRNFRGFSEYKINDIGRINLLVGRNNCGKTSVLEAIYLLKSKGEFSSFLSTLDQRGEKNRSTIKLARDLSCLFYGFQLTASSVFSIRCVGEKLTTTLEHDDTVHTGSMDNDHYKFHINWQTKHEQKNSIVSFGVDNDSIHIEKKQSAHNRTPGPQPVPRSVQHDDVKFIPSFSLSPQMVINLLDKIVLTHDEASALEAVRIIEPDIVRLASLGGSGSSQKIFRDAIIVKSEKWEERLAIGSFGEGIWRLLGLVLSIINAKNSTLLIDEIDIGLHHTVMSKMWKLICATAKKNNVQVFASTHSSDCWKTLADNAVEEEFADMPIRIHRIDKSKSEPETFSNKEMHLALNSEVEVR